MAVLPGPKELTNRVDALAAAGLLLLAAGFGFAYPNLRRRDVHATAQHSLNRARRAGDGALPDLSGLRRYTA